MNETFQKYLLKQTSSTSCKEAEVIQSLWSGYGKISRYQLMESPLSSVVVKHIALDSLVVHPRGWNTDNSHKRKVKSYQVETNWYKQWSDQCGANCKIPNFIGAYAEGSNQWIILEDLNTEYPIQREKLNLDEVKVCLSWLANFHATFLSKKPQGLWKIGTYWNLATRPDEWRKIEYEELKQKAKSIDDILNKSQFQTIVHGDAKLANFCFSEKGDKVAAVDFQYVGGSCGMKDVSYFIGSCLSEDDCEIYEQELLDHYFIELKRAICSCNAIISYEALELEWRSLYPVACADFSRFLFGWMPTHQKINNYSNKLMNSVLAKL